MVGEGSFAPPGACPPINRTKYPGGHLDACLEQMSATSTLPRSANPQSSLRGTWRESSMYGVPAPPPPARDHRPMCNGLLFRFFVGKSQPAEGYSGSRCSPEEHRRTKHSSDGRQCINRDLIAGTHPAKASGHAVLNTDSGYYYLKHQLLCSA